jgi:hypothetical protein
MRRNELRSCFEYFTVDIHRGSRRPRLASRSSLENKRSFANTDHTAYSRLFAAIRRRRTLDRSLPRHPSAFRSRPDGIGRRRVMAGSALGGGIPGASRNSGIAQIATFRDAADTLAVRPQPLGQHQGYIASVSSLIATNWMARILQSFSPSLTNCAAPEARSQSNPNQTIPPYTEHQALHQEQANASSPAFL